MDDTIHYDTDLQTHWWRTIDFLIRVGQAGIVLNAEKFHFARRIVDFAGFRISDETIEPLPKYMDAIRDFPTPTSTTDIRSWFRLLIRLRTMHNCATLWHHSNHFSAQGADWNGHPNLKEPSKHLKSLSSQRSAMVSKSSTQRNEPAYPQIGLVKASGTSCHRNIVRVTRVFLTAVQIVGGSRWPAPDS